MINKKLDITSRAVMVEKKPFYVATIGVSMHNGVKLDFSGAVLLVRPCVSEDDLSYARSEYEELNRRYGKKNNLSFNPMEYYLVLDGNNVYVGNIINKNVCRRVKK